MISIDKKFFAVTLISMLAPAVAMAGPSAGAPCMIGKGVSTALLDLNGNGSFDGVGGGDANFAIAAFDPAPDRYVAGDFNGDGEDEIARYVTSTATYIDQNGNFQFDGVGGGDRSFFFAPGQGFSTPIVGDWTMDNTDNWGIYTAGDQFLLDVNDNGVFDGNGGGDAFFALSAASGLGIPIVGDWNGDGVKDVGKMVGSNNQFILDLNGNRSFDGNGGGDFNGFFAPGQSNSVPIAGDWNGDGTDEIGLYNPNTDVFLLDLNGNRSFDGVGGGDAFFALSAASGAGIPVVCDFDGDGTDQPAKVVGNNAQWIIDLNGNFQFDGVGGGDFNGFFGPGSGTGQPLAGVWVAP